MHPLSIGIFTFDLGPSKSQIKVARVVIAYISLMVRDRANIIIVMLIYKIIRALDLHICMRPWSILKVKIKDMHISL